MEDGEWIGEEAFNVFKHKCGRSNKVNNVHDAFEEVSVVLVPFLVA